ncbi:MAG: GNAT family N-acetyltransferase [Steroidobacteraceae bacterium]|jgi:ribosomal protein S18 acetylase RimI-like enzyme|nr:GNAT family N-acetyltransferase [Steroidobacteraceae bacterium]
MSLVAATAADVDAIVALVESAFRGEASRAGWTTEADLLDGRRTGPDEIGAIVADPGQVILLSRDADGAVDASVNLRRDGDLTWLGMLAVRPPLQGSGLGRRVVEGAEAFARERWGARAMRMKVIVQREELIAWYERRGYRRTGETAPFPYGDARFGLPRREDLGFVVLEKPLA